MIGRGGSRANAGIWQMACAGAGIPARELDSRREQYGQRELYNQREDSTPGSGLACGESPQSEAVSERARGIEDEGS